MQKEPAKSGYEYDWTTRWRRVLHWRAGVGRYIKRCMSKRARRAEKLRIRKDEDK